MFAIIRELDSTLDFPGFQAARQRQKEGAGDITIIKNNKLVKVYCISHEPFPEDFLHKVLARKDNFQVIDNYEA
jgi:hypothetical protein